MNISVRMSAVGAAPRAVVCAEPEATSHIADRIKGPLHQRMSRAIGASETVDVFFVFLYGALETDAFQWVGHCDPDGIAYEVAGYTVELSAPTAANTTITITYPNTSSTESIAFGCFVNGSFFYSNVSIGSIYGGDYP